METNLINTNSAAASGTQSTTRRSTELDKNAFLQLLVAQLQHQDPTQTQDTNAMVQQMTGFSSLEQLQNVTGLLQGIQVQNQGLFQAQAANLVGKRVRVPGSAFELKDHRATIGVDLPSDAKVILTIKDSTGAVVATIDKGTLSSGSNSVEWDGKDAAGNVLADGNYTVEVKATDTQGKIVDAKTSVYVKVDSLSFVNGVVFVVAGGKRFNISDISEIAA